MIARACQYWPGMPQQLDLWYEQENDEAAGKAICALAMKHRESFKRRKSRAVALLGIYEGLNLDRFDSGSYDSAEPFTFVNEDAAGNKGPEYRQTHNLGARIMDAIDAKIFSLERTKTQFVMSDGGWKVKSAGIKAARFIEGQMSEPQGLFKDMWEVWRQAARLATIATTAAMVFFWSDPDQGKIVAELDDTLNVFVETTGLPYDGYSSIGRITYWDPEKLAMRYPAHAERIRAAAIGTESIALWRELYSGEDDETNEAGVLRVPLVQGWRMRQGDPDDGGTEGTEIAAIPGLTLEMKDYCYDYPPCVRFCPMPQLAGKWGRTILERAVEAIRRYNEILNSIDVAERLTPKNVVFYDPTTSDPELMARIKDVIAIPYTGPAGKEPTYRPLDPVSPIVLEILKLHKDAAYDLTGMNESHATMDLGKGLSGVAIRLIKQEVYEMFSPLEDELTRCSGPETAKQIMRCARELQKEGGFTSIWKGGQKGGWLQEISADVFDILEDQTYRTAAQAVSGTANTPADRVQLAEELVQVGIITGEAYAQILQDFNTFGRTGNELSTVEEAFIEKQIDSWMFDDVADAKRRTIAPEVWMDRDLSMTLKVGAAYLQFRVDTIEDRGDADVQTRLGLFKTYLSQLTANAQERAAMATQAQAAANPAAPAQPATAQPGPPPVEPAPAQMAA
jgi:hypothetical protein